MILLVAEFYNSSKEKIIDVNLHNIVNLKDNNNTQSNKTKPSWGVLSNTADINFFDKDGTILSTIKSYKETTEIFCKIYISNTLKKVKEQIAEKYVSNISYDKENKSIKISLKDNLEEWQSISVSGFEFKTAISKPMTAKEMYLYLKSLTPAKFNMCEFSLLDSRTQELLTNTTISYPMLKMGTLWQSWDKFAKAMGIYIYMQMHKNDNDVLELTTIASIDFTVYGV